MANTKLLIGVATVLVVGGGVFLLTRPAPHAPPQPPQTSVKSCDGACGYLGNTLAWQVLARKDYVPPQVVAITSQTTGTKPTTTPNNSTTPGGGDAYGYPIGTETGSVPNPPVILPTVKVDASVPSWATEGALVAGSWDLGLYMCDPATIVNADNYVVENVKQLSRCVGVSTAGLTGSATVALDPSSTANGLPLAMYDVTTTIMGGGQGVTGTDQVQVAYTNLGVYVVSAKFGVGTATSSGGTP